MSKANNEDADLQEAEKVAEVAALRVRDLEEEQVRLVKQSKQIQEKLAVFDQIKILLAYYRSYSLDIPIYEIENPLQSIVAALIPKEVIHENIFSAAAANLDKEAYHIDVAKSGAASLMGSCDDVS